MKGAVVLLAVILLIVTLITFHRQEQVDKRIEQIAAEKRQTINADSLRSVIETRIIDSLKDELAIRDAQLRNLKSDLSKTRKDNETFFNLYRSVDVRMPDY